MLTNMGRINSKSRKSLIWSPKVLQMKGVLFMKSLDITREQATKIQDTFREVKNKRTNTFQDAPIRTDSTHVKLRLYKYEGTNNKIRGFEKLNGLVVKRG